MPDVLRSGFTSRLLRPTLASLLRSHRGAPSLRSLLNAPLVAHAVKAQRLAKVCKLPLSRPGRLRAPWSPSSCTRLPHPSGLLIAEFPLWLHRFGPTFRDFRHFPSCRFNLTVRHIDVILTTLLSIALRRCRPTARSVNVLPLFQRRNSASWSPTHPNQAPLWGTHTPKNMRLFT